MQNIKNCLKYLDGKIGYAIISMIINVACGILLVKWRKNSSNTSVVNSVEKIIRSILDTFVIIKSTLCRKKETNEKITEPEEETSLIKKGEMLLDIFKTKGEIIDILLKFISDNKNSKDPKINEEVKKVKHLLESIKKKGEEMINKIIINLKK